MLKTEQDILHIIKDDSEMMAVIKTAMKLELPDSWVSAGFVRSKIWDVQHGFGERFTLPDVDVIYFDSTDTREETEKVHKAKLRERMQKKDWPSVWPQVRVEEGFE